MRANCFLRNYEKSCGSKFGFMSFCVDSFVVSVVILHRKLLRIFFLLTFFLLGYLSEKCTDEDYLSD